MPETKKKLPEERTNQIKINVGAIIRIDEIINKRRKKTRDPRIIYRYEIAEEAIKALAKKEGVE